MPPSKAQEVLERQRRLAAAMKQKKLKQEQEQKVAEAKAKAAKIKKNAPPPPPKPAAAPMKRPSSHKPATLKRPSTNRGTTSISGPLLKKPATASAVLAAARARQSSTSTSNNDTTTSSSKGRKTLMGATSSATTTGTTESAASVASLPKLTKKANKGPIVEADKSEASDEPVNTTKTIPNIFLNARHYVAAWAPLCLAETRAQVLSEWLNDLGSGRVQRSGAQVTAVMTDNRGPVGRQRGPSMIHPRNDPYAHNNMRLEPEDSVCLKLSAQQRGSGGGGGGGGDLSFVTNDIVLLVPMSHKDLVIGVLNGKYKPNPDEALSDNPFKKWGVVVGHTKCSRKTPHDLIVEVSKRKWAVVPTQGGKRGEEADLWLFKVGSNVTALREFTALCKMDQLPLKRFLLGQHLDPHSQQQQPHSTTTQLHKLNSKTEMLEKMGGSQALGPGFTSYAEKKFNPSQLKAIVASAHEYGEGGFTLIKGPPGTGKTTTLVAVLNSLHIRQYNKYYDQVRLIAREKKNRQFALELARKSKPRLLVCAPSNAAVDNVILKIMEDGFVDGQGKRYNPSMIRIGVGQSGEIRRAVSLEQKVDAIFSQYQDLTKLESTIERHKNELVNLNNEITKCRRRIHAIEGACPWPLSKDWEIRVDEVNFDADFAQGGGRVYFVNHREKATTFEVPPPPEPGENQYKATAMPEYRALMASVVKLVEQCFTIKTQLERCTIVKGSIDRGANHMEVRSTLELHVLNSVHMIMTTLGTAGSRTLEGVDKFEVVVVDEAAQSVEPATLAAFQLGSRHCVLVGDPQQLPATIFNVSGKTTKYDRSLFQRLEEARQPVYMLDEQYRMHPQISHFPRHIFYGGNLRDGPNVTKPDFGNPLRETLSHQLPLVQPFTVLDLDSQEERGGTSLANSSEAHLAVHLYQSLNELSGGLVQKTKVAIITPYSQQTRMLKRFFENALGPRYENFVEIHSVDAYQGREANVVIFSAVRAAGSRGIGFLSDVRRMNVALTRAKHFLFVIARCKSIVINPYWNDLVQHARENRAVLRVPIHQQGNKNMLPVFGKAQDWQLEGTDRPNMSDPNATNGNNVVAALADLATLAPPGKPSDPRRSNSNNNSNNNQNNNNDPRRNTNNNNSQNNNNDPRRNNSANNNNNQNNNNNNQNNNNNNNNNNNQNNNRCNNSANNNNQNNNNNRNNNGNGRNKKKKKKRNKNGNNNNNVNNNCQNNNNNIANVEAALADLASLGGGQFNNGMQSQQGRPPPPPPPFPMQNGPPMHHNNNMPPDPRANPNLGPPGNFGPATNGMGLPPMPMQGYPMPPHQPLPGRGYDSIPPP
ncbi:Probable helicase DDB_G0274399 [Seminavis robusta]|uniref:Probable helicase DDB_G0274399 n=1 Tax=Seminavis robusta TaxID=568900 RepID=A0A9N8EFA1_9STRA|nr:Probable helicase DDB_G0274399 [Seminavis robusta]|eukprot:Sro1067_g237430.1 Probable helicase DDB_G0274399 (1323) ;mRNA; f:28318-32559